MRILVVTNYYPPLELGGWEQLTLDIGLHLEKRGHKIYILTSNYRSLEAPTSETQVKRALHLESYDHLHYHPRYSLVQKRQEAENRKIVNNMVTDFCPDVIYINGMWNLSSAVAKTAEELLPGRVIYYMASYWPAEVNAHTAFWQQKPSRRWLHMPKKIAGAFAQRFLLSKSARNKLDFHLVLCVSAFMREKIVEMAGIPGEQTRVVYNGIDLNLFPLQPIHESSPILRLLYAGRLSPDKGVHTVLESLGIVRQRQPRASIHFSIVGSGSPDYETKLRQLVSSYRVEEWVTFHRQTARERMPKILRDHNVLVFPSIWDEPLARMVQEAMATGLVVIGTATGGTPEILVDGQNGFVFEAGNARMLADKIEMVMGNSELRKKLAAAARITVEERFSLKRMADELESYFSQVVDGEVR